MLRAGKIAGKSILVDVTNILNILLTEGKQSDVLLTWGFLAKQP